MEFGNFLIFRRFPNFLFDSILNNSIIRIIDIDIKNLRLLN